MRRPHLHQKRSLILPVFFLSLSTPSLALSPSLNTRSSTSLLSTSPNTTYEAPLNSGRFGHSSLYLAPPINQLLLLGGQLHLSNDSTSTTTTTTNSVLEFRLDSSYLYGEERPMSAIPNNPSKSTRYSQGFNPTSFVAGGIDYDNDLIYLIGGTKEQGDCSTSSAEGEDQIIQSFNLTSSTSSSSTSSWESPIFTPRLPPRRRQSQLLTTWNSSTLSTDLWVLGGISDSTTSCSSSLSLSGSSPLGYLGIDHYSPSSGIVESFKWDAPEGWEGEARLPVSDYSSQVLEDGTSFVVFGGQTTMGEMVGMEKVLVFNTELREWYTKNVTGDVPPSRMGQISLTLSTSSSSNSSLFSDETTSSPILIHGGLSPSSNATESLFSDSYLLLPPASIDLSPFSPEGEWIWKKLSISNDSMTSPQLAYHAASQVLGGTIIVSFGITSDLETGEEKVSDQIWFLSVDIEEETYSWKDTWEGNSDALADAGMAESEQKRLRKRGLIVEPIQEVTKGTKSMVKRVEIIANPKAYSMKQTASTSSSVAPAETAQGGTWYGQQQGGSGVESQAVQPQPQASSSSPLTSSKIIVHSPSSSPLASSPKSHASSSPSSTTLGASIGGTLGALALLSLAIILIRRSRNARSKIPDTPQMMMNGSSFSGPNSGGPPLVSSLMYTRPLHTRQLSLGSTISELPSPAPSTSSTIRAVDPFSDDYNVNELGQLSRQVSTTSTTRGIAGVGLSRPAATRDSGSGLLERSKSSVTSIPFLSTIALHPSSPLTPSRDSYTSPARTLSIRRTSGMVVPGTPAELIGLAVTSDDGHDQSVYGLPYRAPSTQSGGGGKEVEEGWENFLKKSGDEMGSGLGMREGQGQEEEEGGIPAVLRPATPAANASKGLKVRNADPFVDQ